MLIKPEKFLVVGERGGIKSNMDDWIKKIENTNAVSTIGTLEFVDKISKYYTTDIVCQIDDEVYNNPENFTKEIDAKYYDYDDIVIRKGAIDDIDDEDEDEDEY